MLIDCGNKVSNKERYDSLSAGDIKYIQYIFNKNDIYHIISVGTILYIDIITKIKQL